MTSFVLSGETKFLFAITGSHFFLYGLLFGTLILLLIIFLARRLVIIQETSDEQRTASQYG